MNGIIRTAYAALAMLALLSIAACGGVPNDPSLEVDAVVTKEVIEKFGSIFVNGVEFKTAGATLHLRDDKTDKVIQTEAEVQDLLKKGMVVTVKGLVSRSGPTGTAQEVEFRDTLEAKIDTNGVDPVNGTVTVLGQKINVDDSLKPLLTTLQPGDVIEVSGLPDFKGQIKATFLEKKVNVTEFEAKGFVKLNAGSSTSFTLLLAPGAATGITVNLLAGAALPADGSFIEVKTTTSSGDQITVGPGKIEVPNELKPVDSQKVAIEGFVASGNGDDFIVNGQRVQTNAATLFIGGLKAELGLNTNVQAEGKIVGGILIATSVVIKDSIKIDAIVGMGAIVGGVNAQSSTTGDITLLGKKVIVSGTTLLNGLGNTTLDLRTVAVGQEVLIRGLLAANGTDIVATRLDLVDTAPDPARFKPFLRGPVTAVSGSALTIAGVSVETSGAAFLNAKDPLNPIPIADPATFFSAIILNTTVVKVTWKAPFSTTSVAVKEAELNT